MREWWLHCVCRVRGGHVGGVYVWVASVNLEHVVDQPERVVQPESACNDGFLVRSVSKRIGILGNARSGAEVCLDGVVDLFAPNVESRRWDFDLRGLLLHVEFFPTAPAPIGVVRVADVVFNVDV